MKYFSCVFLFILFSSMNVFSQENYTRHTVSKGETISEIAQHYGVKTKSIYELNPKAKKGIKFRTVLLIPAKSKNKAVSASDLVTHYSKNTHEILPKETVYGIAKRYNISVEDLYKLNPKLKKSELEIGQKIIVPPTDSDNLATLSTSEKEIPKGNPSKKIAPKEEAVVLQKPAEKVQITYENSVYEVLPKESLYSIARQNGITVNELRNANPAIGNKSLKIGQKITVPVIVKNNPGLALKQEALKTEIEPNTDNNRDEKAKQMAVLTQPTIENKTVETEVTRKVLPKETKYGIAKEFGISVKELEKQNPKIVKELPVGYLLKIRSSKIVEATPLVEEVAVKEQVIKDPVVTEDSDKNLNVVHDSTFVDKLISTASENIGIPYRPGGTTKDGFDCSGLMCSTFGAYNIQLPRSSIEMASYGSKINAENAQKGDLIFFKTRGKRHINHVGMVVEVCCDGEIKFIHSSSHGGVIISSTKESYYERNLAQINHVL